MAETKFSPPAWGWSELYGTDDSETVVLPTRVGMVRLWCLPATAYIRSPHPRGDGPGGFRFTQVYREFSPPAWGWSYAVECQLKFAYCDRRSRTYLPAHLEIHN